MKSKLMAICFTVIVASAQSQTVQAQLFYDFVQVHTNDVLATIELSELPANHTDLVALTFTPAGEALFGLGSLYAGTFDQMSFPSTVAEFEPGRLGCVECFAGGGTAMRDLDSPVSSFETSGITSAGVDLEFANPINLSRISYRGTAPGAIQIPGNWLLQVPEPTSLLLVSLAMLTAGTVRMRNSIEH